jgi:hypothetical protein
LLGAEEPVAQESNLQGLGLEERRAYFRNFQDYIFDYEGYSNEEINRMVASGLSESDDEILMNVLAGVAYEALEAVSDEGAPKRSIHEIPEFKPRVLSLIRAGLEDDSWIERRVVPPWWLGYIPLAVYFPADADVEDLIIDSIAAVPSSTGDFLEFFTIGGIDSDRIRSLRFSSLQSENAVVAAKAARGIKATTPQGGLEVLEAALLRRDAALVEVFEAIAAYQEEALSLLPALEETSLELSDYSGPWRIAPIDHQRMQDAVEVLKSAREVDEN